MTRRLTRQRAAADREIAGTLYGLLSLLFIPSFLIAAVAGLFAESGDTSSGAAGLVAGGMVLMALAFPLMYAAVELMGGVICAAVYSLITWLRGMEFEVEDVPTPRAHTPL